MDKYISTNALIEELKRHDFLPVIVKQAIDAVPAAETCGGWINVKDRLPERPPADEWGEFAREWYKVKFEDGFVKDWLFEFNHDSEIPYGFWNDKKHGSVTHWAEIEPPKEEV